MSRHFLPILSILLITLGISAVAGRRVADAPAQALDSIPQELGGWTVVEDQALDAHTLGVLKPTRYLSRTYSRDGRALGLFVAYYDQQRAGESMHSPKNCLPGSGWEISSRQQVDLPAGHERVRVNSFRVQSASARLMVLYWYQSRKRIHYSEFAGKFYTLFDAILNGVTSGSIVRVTVPDEAASREEAVRFASVLIPEVQRCLGR